MQITARIFAVLVAVAGVADDRAADEMPATTKLPRAEVTIHLPDGEKPGRVLLSPDGSRIAVVAGRDGETLRLFDSRRCRLEQTFSGHKNHITSLAFSPDGKRLVTGGFDGTVRIWNISSGKEERRVEVADEALVALAISPDGKMLAIGTVAAPESRDSLGKAHRYLGENGALQVQELAGGKALPEFTSGGKGTCAVAYSPDGRNLATSRWLAFAEVWDTTARKVIRTLDNDACSCAFFLAFSRDGQSLFTDNTGACSWAVVWELNVAAKAASNQFFGRPGGPLSGAVFALAGNRTILGHTEDGIYVFDREFHKPPTDERKRTALLDKRDAYLREHRNPLGILSCERNLHIMAMDVSSDAKKLVASLDDGTVRLWDLTAALKPIIDGRR
jgi:WD40 repeat protein